MLKFFSLSSYLLSPLMIIFIATHVSKSIREDSSARIIGVISPPITIALATLYMCFCYEKTQHSPLHHLTLPIRKTTLAES